ncbi:MAG: site-specific DNA-methyltransferase, partial [Clostridia bacterium]|nr:site-specific DNA-methyltransferase [Clostridia bacterium]
QKPVKILEHIIKIASNPDDVVFDMFMGVGSTGVAAHNLDRKFIGIEIDKTYFDAAEKRIAENLRQKNNKS